MAKRNNTTLLIYGKTDSAELQQGIRKTEEELKIQIGTETGGVKHLMYRQYDLYFIDIDRNEDWQEKTCFIPDPHHRLVLIGNSMKEYREAFRYHCYDFLYRRETDAELKRILQRYFREIREVIPVRINGRKTEIPVTCIKAVEAERNRICLITGRGCLYRRGTLKKLAADYGLMRRFVRINRSQLIAVSEVETVKGSTVWMKDGSRYYISRRFLSAAKSRLMNGQDVL